MKLFGNEYNTLESALSDILGNPLFAANIFLQTSKGKSSRIINKLKNEFYSKLSKFENSGYTPDYVINQESLSKFYEFKDLDWNNRANLDKVISCYISFKT